MEKNKSNGKTDRKIEQATTKKENTAIENKREKKLSSAQKALPVLIVLTVSLAIILIATLIAFFQLKSTEDQNSKTLEAVYASSYFNMVDGINNLQIDSSKFETLQNVTAQRKTLKNMEQDCQFILSGLDVLPIEAQSCMSASKFFNQIDGMCEAYINTLDKGDSLTANQIALVNEMGVVLGNIKEQFNNHNMSVSKSGYSFIDASVFNSEGVNEFSNMLGSLSSTQIEYPTMIFDGPFSASLETKTIKGLSEEEITVEEAQSYLKEKVFYGYDDIEIDYIGETDGDFVTYDFKCIVNKEKYEAQITKREGKLLTMNSYADSANPVLSKDEAVELAETFSKRIGFENLKAVWLDMGSNIAYINLAPVVNDVIYYPDLVKIKIDLASERVLGFEAQNYCFNHTNRNLNQTITENEARNVIDGDFVIESAELALITLDNEKEVLTYELKCEGLDGLYYFYVNASDLKIEEILKVVNQQGSNLLI